jgi:hypothetical protein
MKYLPLLALYLSFSAALASPAMASTETVSTVELQKQIAALQVLLQSLEKQPLTTGAVAETTAANPLITSFDDGKKGKPKITLTAPVRKKSTFSKSNPNDPIVIKWVAYNVPEKTNLTIDQSNVKIKGPVGGGSYQFALPAGDSKGEYKLTIHGEGYASAGTYRIQLGLEQCSSRGCGYNAHFPGQEENVTLYAQSKSVGVTITGTNPKTVATKVATVSTIDDVDTPNPTVTGVAQAGVTSVGFSIGQGDKVYGSGPISVTNGRWSHTISQDLKSGSYTLSLYVNDKLSEEKKFTVK